MNNCLICKERTDNQKYCSMKCYGLSKKGRPTWSKGKKGLWVAWNKGKSNYNAHLHLGKYAQKGATPWNKQSDKLCQDCGKKICKVKGVRRCNQCASQLRTGKGNHNWKGGLGTERHKLMRRKEYILWRIAIFMKDDFTCQKCKQRGGYLEADHIKPWVLYPELRYAIDNGRTLCLKCHRKTDTWGRRVFLRQHAF